MSMTPAQRVQAAFDKRPTDRVPIHHIGVSSRAASVVLGREAWVGGGINQWREAVALWQGEAAHQEFLERSFRDALDFATATQQDIIRADYWRMATKPAQRLDEYTFLYGDDEEWAVWQCDPHTELYQIIRRSPKPEVSLDDLEKQVEASEKSTASYKPTESLLALNARVQKALGPDCVVRAGYVSCGIPYKEPAWLEAIALRPDLVARYLDTQAEYAARNVAFLAPRGIKHFWGGGDFASNDGPFYSPKVFHELMLPRLKRISDACHQQGAYHLFASDGNLWPVADDLFGASGVDGFYEIDRRAGMDLKKLRARFPHLTLVGANISSYTLHRGTKEQVAEETHSCLEDAKRLHGIIVGVSNQIVGQTPPENMMTMVEVIARHR